MDLQQQFKKNWEHKKFATIEQRVLLAVSGGIDSMVMAELFLRSKIQFGIAHCNFQLRGNDSELDEKLVIDWAITREIPIYNVRFDTKPKCEEWKKGVQETARILRYEWLDKVRTENDYRYIATAHHANDNVETLMMNLFKGTGMSGLHGIPERNEHIIRPILFAKKEDVIAFSEAHKVLYRDDVSNATDAYLRNAVRHHIIPKVKEWFPNVVEHVNSSISRFAQAEILYRKAVEEEKKKLTEQRGQDIYIPVLKLRKRVPLETICYELFYPYGFTSAQIPHILELLDSESGKMVLSTTHRIIRNRDFLIITSIPEISTDIVVIEYTPCKIDTGKYKFSFSVEPKPSHIPTDNNTACVDMKQVRFPLILRKWKTGDYFYPLGMGMKKKKISRYLVDSKIALHDKENVWVLESDKRIVWLTGMRLDDRFKVKDSTEEVLLVTIKNEVA